LDVAVSAVDHQELNVFVTFDGQLRYLLWIGGKQNTDSEEMLVQKATMDRLDILREWAISHDSFRPQRGRPA
jgi:hypothetical protein